ncbi:MAG: class A beta-lactamase [Burkholderiaceae bacterium]|nr:class A beta-lactamase [Burkholderiaceae bacterium]
MRRKLLIGAALAPAASLLALPSFAAAGAAAQLRLLEAQNKGRIGLALLDAEGSPLLLQRAEELFPFCSTFKMMLSACVLRRSVTDAALMQRGVAIERQALVSYSPVVEKHVGATMTVEELCIAAMEYSDNAAANLLLDMIGGIETLNAFARSVGDEAFTLNRHETELGKAIPGDRRDTTTPLAMAHSLQRLALGDELPQAQRGQLLDWMRANRTGSKRIRAGVPQGWLIGDKTGSGDYGTTNDIAVLHRPDRTPLILTIYFTQEARDAPLRDEVLAVATRIALAGLA